MGFFSTFLLAAQSAVRANNKLPEVPIVDLAAPSAIAAREIEAALSRYGFFYIRNHGISESLLNAQFEQSEQLFALPASVKRSLTFVPHLDIGYLESGGQALDEESGILDQKEGFMMTNNGVFDPAFELNESDPLQGATLHWPPKERVPHYEIILREYVQQATRVTHALNKLLFASLGLSEGDRKSLASKPFTVLKQMKYAQANAKNTNELGAGAHADWGTLTVLATDGTPGLQVEFNDGWLPVPPRDGCLIVNAGDQIAHWTNGKYRSANHRVLNLSPQPRYSTAFFTYFDIDALVVPLPQFVSESQPAMVPARTTREYFHFKLFESTGKLDLLDNSSDVCRKASSDVSKCTNAEQSDTNWTIKALSNDARIGVEVIGLELASAPNSIMDTLVRAMHNDGSGVLIVRGQNLDPPELERVLDKFAPYFGKAEHYDRWPGQSKGIPCCSRLSLLGNYRAKERGQFGMECEVGEVIGEYKPARDTIDEWHTDGSFLLHPKVAIALYAPNISEALPEQGGETKFASCTRFWESLPREQQMQILGLEAVHSWETFMKFLEARDPSRAKVTAADCAKHPDVTFPLVRTHPYTGKQSVFINPKNTKRVSAREGAPLMNWTHEEGLAFIQKLGSRIVDGGVYRHVWRRGDFVIWDNRVLLHAASPFNVSKYERLLIRMEFPGESVFSPAVGDVVY